MNKSINQLVGEITSLAVLITQNTKDDVFINYSGHINGLEIGIHIGGWKVNLSPDVNETIYLTEKHNSEKDILKKLNEIKRKLVKFAIKGGADLSSLPYEIREVKDYKLIGRGGDS